MTAQQQYPISPEHFWAEFSTRLQSVWNSRTRDAYMSDRAWTSFLTQMLTDMGSALGCHVHNEYWPRVDVSYFDRRSDSDWEEWSREVAIELENNGETWTEEVCKLLEINAGLKVVVAYAWSRSFVDKVLADFTTIHASRKYHTTPCHWLFIIGPYIGTELDDFIAFKSDGRVTSEITGSARIITAPAAPMG